MISHSEYSQNLAIKWTEKKALLLQMTLLRIHHVYKPTESLFWQLFYSQIILKIILIQKIEK